MLRADGNPGFSNLHSQCISSRRLRPQVRIGTNPPVPIVRNERSFIKEKERPFHLPAVFDPRLNQEPVKIQTLPGIPLATGFHKADPARPRTDSGLDDQGPGNFFPRIHLGKSLRGRNGKSMLLENFRKHPFITHFGEGTLRG